MTDDKISLTTMLSVCLGRSLEQYLPSSDGGDFDQAMRGMANGGFPKYSSSRDTAALWPFVRSAFEEQHPWLKDVADQMKEDCIKPNGEVDEKRMQENIAKYSRTYGDQHTAKPIEGYDHAQALKELDTRDDARRDGSLPAPPKPSAGERNDRIARLHKREFESVGDDAQRAEKRAAALAGIRALSARM